MKNKKNHISAIILATEKQFKTICSAIRSLAKIKNNIINEVIVVVRTTAKTFIKYCKSANELSNDNFIIKIHNVIGDIEGSENNVLALVNNEWLTLIDLDENQEVPSAHDLSNVNEAIKNNQHICSIAKGPNEYNRLSAFIQLKGNVDKRFPEKLQSFKNKDELCQKI